ncbi:putative salt-induced outer membrane protein [Methylophaga frappieri]|uniref:Putative salt-induced outer membrane protein n=1 Tax=Methylophaga frappieri (strain ATCC BAA-2434 / DSM 25690 / JAM7) TaxID=754477 RepID=I1YH85_METFJ|nr:DUF481 domain-containing protein [Methylophaga frappieri]AFJ02278.1 putative salt-induced outer membrane protein [Methylophaga frappieri]
MLKRRMRPLALLLSAVFSSQVFADQVVLNDGSQLNGTIQQIADGKLILDTAFADEVTIDFSKVTKLTTDKPYMIQLESSDRIVGQIATNANGQHQLTGTAFGDVPLDPANIETLWPAGTNKPQLSALEAEYEAKLADAEATKQAEVDQIQQSYETQLQQVREENTALKDPWRGNLAIGVQGAKGNTERFAATGRGELFRETEAERMAMYMEINYAKEDGEQTENEKLAGISLERDISENYFARGSADFEIDDFEELDLRAIATASIGRFFIREEDLVFKGFAGLGYRFESYSDGTNEKDPTGVLGYDVNYKMNSRLRLFHDLTYYPSFSSPGQNYLVVTNFGGEMPITESEAWKVRASLRSQYNSQPAIDAEKTDTSYRLNLVYDWD